MKKLRLIAGIIILSNGLSGVFAEFVGRDETEISDYRKNLDKLTDIEQKVLLALSNDDVHQLVRLRRDYLSFQFDEPAHFDKFSAEEKKFLSKKGDFYGFLFNKNQVSKKYRPRMSRFVPFAEALTKVEKIEVVHDRKYPHANKIVYEYNNCNYSIELPCDQSGCYLRGFVMLAETGRGTCF